jgi:tRNA threonylcarbamoyladenosine biosynthesis protein TsaB
VIVLGIESATEVVGAAVSDGERSATLSVSGRRHHGETLAPVLAEVLERAGLQLGDIDALAVDVGPGLFTGLRVGVATAKGLAQGLGLGILGLTSLEVLAAGALEGGWPGGVLALVDGRRGEVFAGRYRRGAAGDLIEVTAPARHRPAELAALAAREPDTLAIGDGARRYREELAGVSGLVLAGPTRSAPEPAVLVALARARLAGGAVPGSADALVPCYLREADVRINWASRARVPSA